MQSMALVMIATSEGSIRRVTYSLAVYPCTACICQLIGSDVRTQFVPHVGWNVVLLQRRCIDDA